MRRVILFNKPHAVLCQFSAAPPRKTLKDYIPVRGVYPAGRLDADSEGLVVLTDNGTLQHRISDPRHKLAKIYWVQVEGSPTQEALSALKAGVKLGDFATRPAAAELAAEPPWLWPRDPAVRYRKSIPTSWLRLAIREGKNRQVRRMTAAVGYPTLRLIRFCIGEWDLTDLAPGEWREVGPRQREILRCPRQAAGNPVST